MCQSHAFMEKWDDGLLQGVIPRHIPPLLSRAEFVYDHTEFDTLIHTLEGKDERNSRI